MTKTFTPDPEIMRAILTKPRALPVVEADLAMYRRLEAMHERMKRSDLPDEEPTTFEEVVYCAIMGGLRESEADYGEPRNEHTGMPLAISPYADPHRRRTQLRRLLKLVFPH